LFNNYEFDYAFVISPNPTASDDEVGVDKGLDVYNEHFFYLLVACYDIRGLDFFTPLLE